MGLALSFGFSNDSERERLSMKASLAVFWTYALLLLYLFIWMIVLSRQKYWRGHLLKLRPILSIRLCFEVKSSSVACGRVISLMMMCVLESVGMDFFVVLVHNY